MKKRILATLVMTAMLCRIFCTTFVVTAAETAELPEGVVHMEDFDDGKSSLSPESSWIEQSIEKTEGGGYIKSVNLGSGSEAYGTHRYPTVTMSEEELIHTVSVDVMFEESDYYGHILVASGVWTLVFSILDGHIVFSGHKQTALSDSLPSFEYETGKWYTLTMSVDTSKKRADFYVDGVRYGDVVAGRWSNTLTLRVERYSGLGGELNTMYIDNLKFGDETAFTPYVEVYPLELVCEELGQSFWSKSVDFGVNVNNITDAKKTYDVTCELVSDLGLTEFTRTDTVEVEAGESKLLEYEAELLRYALYDLNITSVEKDSGETFKIETELVTIKKSELQNPMHAIMEHAIDTGHGFDRYPEKYEALRNAGMSGLRMSLWWSTYEPQPGVYNMPNKYKEALERAEELDMDVLFVTGFNNEAVAPGEWAPLSPPSLAAFAEYAYHQTIDTSKYSAGYEIWNEWNVLDHFNKEGHPASKYVDLIKPTYKRIKDADPNAKVYGLSGMTWNRTDLYKQMAEEMFENGVADYCDGFSIHSYKGFMSPDTGEHVAGLDYTQELMDKYGVGDRELIITEMGWQAVNSSPEEVATWVAKYAAMIHDKVARIYWYCSQRKPPDGNNEGEQSYGWMQGDEENAGYVPYAPLPQLRAISAYNSYIAGSDKKSVLEIADGNAVIHRFKRSDGKDVLMAWVKDGSPAKEYAITLGANSATVADIYGNEEKHKASGGKLYINLTNSPQYITGSFGEIAAEPSDFSVSAKELDVTTDDRFSFAVVKDSKLKNVKTELKLPDGMSVFENKGFKGDRAEITVSTGSALAENSVVEIEVADSTTGEVYYTNNILINRTINCALEITPKLTPNGRWMLGVSLKNLKRSAAVSGELQVVEPVLRENKEVKFRFDKLGAQSKITKNVFIPAFLDDSTLIKSVKCSVALDTGEKIEVEEEVSFNGIASTDKPPVIDGVISAGEWNKAMPFILDSESNKPTELTTTWDGVNDLSARFYYNWDRENLYIAAEVTDNVLCDSVENKTWQNDGIQVAFALGNERTTPRTELGLSLMGGKEVFERTAWMALGAEGLGNVQDDYDFGDTEYKITRDENMTYYEMKIPWEEIADEDFDILDHKDIYMSILLNDNDGAGRRGWLETSPGIGYLKTALTFEKVKLFR